MDHLDVPWVGFILGVIRMDLTFAPFPSHLLPRPWTLDPVGSFIGFYSHNCGLKCPRDPLRRVSLFYGLGLVPQSVVVSSPSFLESLVSWL